MIIEPTFDFAFPEKAKVLTRISVKAFHSDIEAGGKSMSGPPGYNSVEFHIKMMKSSAAFYKISIEDEIVGALWIFRETKEKFYIARIFINPEYHRIGIGTKAFSFLYLQYPNAKTWCLEIPKWNTRTNEFYATLGFVPVRKTDKEVFFEKNMSSVVNDITV